MTTDPSLQRYQSDAAIAEAAALIAEASAIVVAAGAGIGIDSGLPDFRGPQGFWGVYPGLKAAGLQFQEVASPAAFHALPEIAWGFYGHRLNLYRATAPHAGFALLRRWMAAKPDGGGVFTSNVDGQFHKAGFDAARIVECHGTLHRLQCLAGCSDATWPADDFEPQVDEANCRLLSPLPRCPHCGALARPNVLMFGDYGWSGDRHDAARDRLDDWLAATRKPVVIEIGAGSDIATVRRFSEQVVRRHRGALVRINPREFKLPAGVGQGLALGALQALTRIDAALGASPPATDAFGAAM